MIYFLLGFLAGGVGYYCLTMPLTKGGDKVKQSIKTLFICLLAGPMCQVIAEKTWCGYYGHYGDKKGDL